VTTALGAGVGGRRPRRKMGRPSVDIGRGGPNSDGAEEPKQVLAEHFEHSAPGVQIDLGQLLRLRLVVGRYGEMDGAAWWNTNGMLGRYGAIALARGLPRTYRFSQARVVFNVARSRCEELFHAPGSVTLWHLPAEIEDQFDERWQGWLNDGDAWNPFFDDLAATGEADLLAELRDRDLLSDAHSETIQSLRRSAEGRAVQLPGEHELDDDLITLLAGGFSKGERGAPAIPYARLAD